MAEQRQFVNPAHFNWLGPGYNAEAMGNGKYKVTSERYLPEPVVVDTKSGSFNSMAVRKKFGEQAIRARKLEDFNAGLMIGRSLLPAMQKVSFPGLPLPLLIS